MESLYAHISSPGAWETEDSDDHRAAKCSHMLLALLHSFTERFRYLKAPHHQLEFFHGTQHRMLEIFLKEVAGKHLMPIHNKTWLIFFSPFFVLFCDLQCGGSGRTGRIGGNGGGPPVLRPRHGG